MTREEEIREASIDYQLSTNPRAIGGDAFADMAREMNVNPSFIAGAKWADSRPRKGIVDIDKAYEWIACHITEYLDRSDWMAEEFKEAMEEQQ